jgi:DNA replication protein DnaC
VAHGDGSFSRRLMQLARLDLLVLDDLAIAPIAANEREDLLELLDDRAGSSRGAVRLAQSLRGGK